MQQDQDQLWLCQCIAWHACMHAAQAQWAELHDGRFETCVVAWTDQSPRRTSNSPGIDLMKYAGDVIKHALPHQCTDHLCMMHAAEWSKTDVHLG